MSAFGTSNRAFPTPTTHAAKPRHTHFLFNPTPLDFLLTKFPARVRTYCCPEMEKDDRVGVMISGSVWSAFAESTFTFEVEVEVVVVVDASDARIVQMGMGEM